MIERMRARWSLLAWRWNKWLMTSRARRYREELHFRHSKGFDVTVEEWQRANQLLREASEF